MNNIHKTLFFILLFSANLLSQVNNENVVNFYYGELTPHYIAKNDSFKTPYYIIGDTNKGPKIIIDACIHGDEIAGYFACNSILRNISISFGSLLIVPKLNILAFNKQARELKNDLNRQFYGNSKRDSTSYEYKLADEFFKLIIDFKPLLILNLHEDKDYIDSNVNLDFKDTALDVNFGNCIIACPIAQNRQNQIDELLLIQDSINSKISNHDSLYKFYNIVNANKPEKGYSLDLFEKEGFKSYTIETYRNQDINGVYHVFKVGFTLEDRVNLHILAILTFFEKFGIEFNYKDREIPIKLSRSRRVN